jgi:hypothetical protein
MSEEKPMTEQAGEGVIAEVLGSTREVNGGELESVLTIYNAEGLAVLVEHALRDAGYRIVHPAAMHEDCDDWWTCCIHTPPEDVR